MGAAVTKRHENIAKWLNETCPCSSLARKLLPDVDARDFIFSSTPVYLSSDHHADALKQIAALETAIKSEPFQKRALSIAPAIAGHDQSAHGVFMGYDFHIGESGPMLIEINTNAGGAYLVDALYRAQDVCCWSGEPLENPDFLANVQKMFESEWRAFDSKRDLKTIAIVDEEPEKQFLYSEFLLFKAHFEAAGYHIIISDPAELVYDKGVLKFGNQTIDLIYNRSTDFYFENPTHAAIKAAYLANDVLVTPNPRHHALYAAKRNLHLLSDQNERLRLALPKGVDETLNALPAARLVTPENADEMWQSRKQLFFKPIAGHGGKAVYRGDKITKKTWGHILEGGFIAQELTPPETRFAKCAENEEPQSLKSDIRYYTYDGDVILAVARLYQGQTTNFRTVGGGFAPIYVI